MSLTLDLTGIVNEAIDQKLEAFDIEGQIKELLGDVAKNASKVIEVRLHGKEEGTKIVHYHMQFETLLTLMSIQSVNVLLTGGAGLSKTTAITQAAEALGLEFNSISFSNQSTKTDLLGYMDANGIYRMSAFVDAFKNGKVFLADEMDACSSNVLVLLNSAISNGFLETPEGETITAHENFRFAGTANTNLRGAGAGFTARNKLDAATIDRFVVLEWELDEELEAALTGNDAWLKIVRKCRKVASENFEDVTITPRSSYDGAKLLKAGLDVDRVIEMTIIKAMGEDERDTLLRGITEKMKADAIKAAGGKVTPKEPTPEPEPEIEVIKPDDVQTFAQSKQDSFDW